MDSFEPIPPPLPETPAAPLPAPARADENPVFNLGDVLIIAVVAFVILSICLIAAAMVASAAHLVSGSMQDIGNRVSVSLPAQVVGYALCIGFMVVLIRAKYHTRFRDAIRWNPPSRRWIYGAIALGSGLGLANALFSGLLERWIPKSLPIEEIFRSAPSAYAFTAFGVFVAPLMEELFFRGFLYPALARPLGSLLSVALTGGFFALLHSPQLANAWIPLLLLFVIGIILTVVRAKTKSVATCVIVHMSYNTTLFAMVYIGTGGFRHLERM